jgi:mono/diheme cytochrome c family protein
MTRLTSAPVASKGGARKTDRINDGARSVGKPSSSRKLYTPALGALALAAGLAAGIGGLASSAQAEDAKPSDLVAAGRDLFNTWSCSQCHTLTDAGSSGAIGPNLDNPKLTHDFIVARITNGSGPMPSFGGQISDADIAKLADYIVAVNHKGGAVAAAPAPEGQTKQ